MEGSNFLDFFLIQTVVQVNCSLAGNQIKEPGSLDLWLVDVGMLDICCCLLAFSEVVLRQYTYFLESDSISSLWLEKLHSWES